MTPDPRDLRIRIYPDEVLRRRADPVEPSPHLDAIAARMIDLMRDAEGIGLAAPQVGLPWRLFVCDVPPDPDDTDDPDEHDGEDQRQPGRAAPAATDGPRIYLNPEIVGSDGPVCPYEEGCLSLPDIRGQVMRPPTVTLRALAPDGSIIEERAAGLLARCWQHEIDHLDGVLIIDRMVHTDKLRARAAVRQLERRAAR